MSAGLAAAFERATGFLRDNADTTSAAERKHYLKSERDVLGAPVPAIRKAARDIRRTVPAPKHRDLVRELDALWASPVHEDRVLAILAAQQFVPLFTHADIARRFRRWLGDCQGWDLIDALCCFVIGPAVLEMPAAWPDIAKWAGNEKFWIRRASVLCHIASIRAGRVNTKLLLNTCTRLIEEKEFFIRKAIGWTLRESARKDAKAAEKMILNLGPNASGLTLREASRNLPKATRRRIYRALDRPLPKEF